ncbi:hypothetical protein NitYY0826_C0641 [Nitratiruptor sp. YY08-26]|uniref:thioredoxin family protein n=1 Tax=unclassified Nitratiruptor TaxID=2624044 RepID=UPI001914F67C|nr:MULTISPECIES: DUF255 domain-containing protein [unclassified Nitratiruptor]BCD61778.1 hypothetical protein NitYY0813_C0639 [Nitratiruptor sp. YY08-13]BCD65713.1 hypothetical protein NitYY0826_C0641 [Nitratiruptor sp. YY08-26]
MRKILILILASLTLFASINWYTDFNKAYQESLATNKPLFVFIERLNPPCQWCHKMKTTTLKDPKIIDFIKKYFIAVKLDRDTSDYPDELYPRYVPTIYVIQKEKVIKRIIGYWSKEDFWSDLKDIERTLHK